MWSVYDVYKICWDIHVIWYDICYDIYDIIDIIYNIWYLLYDIFVNRNLVDTRWQQYSTHLHANSTQNNTMKQNTQNGTYTAIRIHKHDNKNTKFTKLTRSIQNIQPCIQLYDRIRYDTMWYMIYIYIWCDIYDTKNSFLRLISQLTV